MRLRYWLVSGGMMMRSRLRHDHEAQRLPAREADRLRRLRLALGHAQDARAHDLGNEAGGVDGEAEQQRHELGQHRRCRPAKLKP